MGTVTVPITDLAGGRVDAVLNVTVNTGTVSGRFVSPTATNGNGTIGNPWSLAQAMLSAQAGDTVWLRGGNYVGATKEFLCNGNPINPITFRSYPLEWAWLQLGVQYAESTQVPKCVLINGGSIRLRDMTVQTLMTTRVREAGNMLESVKPDTKLINLICTDGGVGIAAFAGAGNWEANGVIAINQGALPGGDCYYINNTGATGTKKIRHCISGFAHSSIYAIKSIGDRVENILVEDSSAICPAAFYEQGEYTGNTVELYAGGIPGDNVVFDGLISYAKRDLANFGGLGFNHFYGNVGIKNITIRRSILDSRCSRPTGANTNDIAPWKNEDPIVGTLTLEDTVISSDSVASTRLYWEQGTIANRVEARNKYHCVRSSEQDDAFRVRKNNVETDYTFAQFAQFKAAVGDTTSTLAPSGLPPDWKRVHKCDFERGRANIHIGNENAKAATVNVNLDTVLNNGEQWWLYNAFNPYVVCASGTYVTGAGINVPMTVAGAGANLKPSGNWNAAPSALPDRGAFVVRRVGPNWVAPPLSLVI